MEGSTNVFNSTNKQERVKTKKSKEIHHDKKIEINRDKSNNVHPKMTVNKGDELEPSEPKADDDLKYDDATSEIIGDIGFYQLRIAVLMTLLKVSMPWFQLDIVFLAPPQEFWCQKPAQFCKFTDEQWRDICSPKVEEHPCLIYDPEQLLAEPDIGRKHLKLVPCKHFVYDQSIFNRTIISEWDLVCSRHWLIHLSQVIFMWGVLLGGVIFGILADKYGRRMTLMVAIFLQTMMSLISSMMPWYWGFIAMRFVLALASGGIGVISFVYCIEMTGGKWRTIIPILYHLPFGLGNTVMAILAYLLRDWRKLEFSMGILSSFYLVYWFYVTESPRWLIAKGEMEKAITILKDAAKINNKSATINPKIVSRLQKKAAPAGSVPAFRAFMKSRNMKIKTLVLSATWFCTGLSFYAFSQYLGSIGGNIFLTVSMCGIISTPGALVCVVIINKWGRKKSIAAFHLITALCFFFIMIIPKYVYVNDWPRCLFAGIGFAGMAGAVPALYLLSGELFPTVGRNVGVGGVNTFARIGSMMAPGLVSLGDIREELPMIILTLMSMCQVLLLIPLPETMNVPLPDTLEEAEKIDRNYSQRYRMEEKVSMLNK